MSEYIHEIVLQEYIIEHISLIDLTIQYQNISRYKVIDARKNTKGTFWDLEGKLETGVWIPIEVEWITQNFFNHKHNKDTNFDRFIKENGIILVLRKSKETPNIQQHSILESILETEFRKSFKRWYKTKADEYIDKTLKDYMIGSYKRDIPRIIIYPLGNKAKDNYFVMGQIYKKHTHNPAILGFKETGFNNNAFIRDLMPNDICIFINSQGNRCKRPQFIEKIRNAKLKLHQLTAYRITGQVFDRRIKTSNIDELYWPDEIKEGEMIYPYICELEKEPFIHINDRIFPYISSYREETWEAFRSCIQYGEYREVSPLDFTLLMSNL